MPNQTCRFLSNGYKFQITDNNKLRLMPCCKWLGSAEENPQNFQQQPILEEKFVDFTII